MDTFYCRAVVSVYDPSSNHSYNEREMNRYVEAATAEEAMAAFRLEARKGRYPTGGSHVLVKFKDVNQRYDGRDIGVIPYKRKRK